MSDKKEKWVCDECKTEVKAKNVQALRSARYYHRTVKCPKKGENKSPKKTEQPKPQQNEVDTLFKVQEKLHLIEKQSKKIDDYCMIVLGLYSAVFNAKQRGIREALMKDQSFYMKLKHEFLEEHKEDVKKMLEHKEKTMEEKKRKLLIYKDRLERYTAETKDLAKELGETFSLQEIEDEMNNY